MCLLDKIQASPMPLADHLGIEFLEAEPDQVTAWMQIRPEHCTVGHKVHGGVIMAFGDSLGGATAAINLPGEAVGTVTVESKTNFIGAAKAGSHLVGIANVLHRGRRTQLVNTRIETGDGKVVAFVTQTQMTIFADGPEVHICDEDYLGRNRLADAAS